MNEDLEEAKKLLLDLGYDLSDEELIEFAVSLAKGVRDFVSVARVESMTIYFEDIVGDLREAPDEDIFKILPVLRRFPNDLL